MLEKLSKPEAAEVNTTKEMISLEYPILDSSNNINSLETDKNATLKPGCCGRCNGGNDCSNSTENKSVSSENVLL